METGSRDLEQLMRVFYRMHHKSLRAEFDRRKLSEVSHPPILFMLKSMAPDMSATQIDISRQIGIAPATVAISVKRMEKAGLVSKSGDSQDLRRNYISLTSKGLRLLAECESASRQINRETFNGFTEEEREHLRGYFMRMIANLEAAGISPPARFRNKQSD